MCAGRKDAMGSAVVVEDVLTVDVAELILADLVADLVRNAIGVLVLN